MINETTRRRNKQIEYNTKHSIQPKTIYKTVDEIIASTAVADVKAARDDRRERAKFPIIAESIIRYLTKDQRKDMIEELYTTMRAAAKDLEFERAAQLRDEINRLEKLK